MLDCDSALTYQDFFVKFLSRCYNGDVWVFEKLQYDSRNHPKVIGFIHSHVKLMNEGVNEYMGVSSFFKKTVYKMGLISKITFSSSALEYKIPAIGLYYHEVALLTTQKLNKSTPRLKERYQIQENVKALLQTSPINIQRGCYGNLGTY